MPLTPCDVVPMPTRVLRSAEGIEVSLSGLRGLDFSRLAHGRPLIHDRLSPVNVGYFGFAVLEPPGG